MDTRSASRRRMLTGAGAVGMATLVAACQTYGGAEPPSESEQDNLPGAGNNPKTGGKTAGATGDPKLLGKKADIPVGGGKIFDDQNVVVTQPTAGSFKCFSAICTHQGCTVAEVKGGTINCPCHGSKFKIADGSVAQGPANKALPAKNLKVEGDTISLA